MVFEVETGMNLQDRRVLLTLVHQTDLVGDQVPILVGFGLAEFEGTNEVISTAAYFEHLSEAALTNFV